MMLKLLFGCLLFFSVLIYGVSSKILQHFFLILVLENESIKPSKLLSYFLTKNRSLKIKLEAFGGGRCWVFLVRKLQEENKKTLLWE